MQRAIVQRAIVQRAIIQANTVIGNHVLINTGITIDHDNVIGDFVHIAPGSFLCGHVEVGEGSLRGVGVTVRPGIKVGRWCTVGAGAVVTANLPDYCTAVGVPATMVAMSLLSDLFG